jgi:hypothetical protein
VQNFVKLLSTDTLKQIGKDWDEYSLVGSIGDCTLRKLATEQMKLVDSSNVTWWMRDLAFEAYRELYMRSINL